MCGEGKNSRIKNVSVFGVFDATNLSTTKTLALPFAPNTVEVTHISYVFSNVPADYAGVLVVKSPTLLDGDERLLTLALSNETDLPVIVSETKCFHEIFELRPNVQGLHVFQLNLDGSGGLLVAPFQVQLSLNLRFSS